MRAGSSDLERFVLCDLPCVACHARNPLSQLRRSLVSAPLAAFVVCMRKGRIVWRNPAAVDLARRCGCELLGRDVRELFAPEERGHVERLLDRLDPEDSIVNETLHLQGAGARPVALQTTWSALHEGSAAVRQVLCFLRPRDDRVQWRGEGAIQLDDIPDLVHQGALCAIVTDASGRIRALTEDAAHGLGDPAAVAPGRSIEDIAADDRSRDTIGVLLRTARDQPGSPISGWIWVRAGEPGQPAGERTATFDRGEERAGSRTRRAAMAVDNRLDDPLVQGLLWYQLPLGGTPMSADDQGDPRAYTSFLEHQLLRIGQEVERSGPPLQLTRAARARALPGVERLSEREREVFNLLAEGLRAPTIARRLFVSQSTVRNHVSAVFRKLGVRSQPELLELLAESSSTPLR